MRYLLTTAFLAIFQLTLLTAQDAQLNGTITDAATGEALIAATVQLGSHGTTTGLDGTFSISLAPGRHTLEISYIGYDIYIEDMQLAAGEQKTISIELQETATMLETATVTSGRFEKPLGEVTVSMEVLKPDLINQTNKTNISGALEKVSGLTMIDGQANIRGGSGYSYGAGSRVLLLVDDLPILQPDSGFPNWADVPTENIAQVEVVKGASSALYGTTALNGIVNIRTAYAKSDPETKIGIFTTHFLNPAEKSYKWWDDAPYHIGASVSHRRKMGKVDLVLGGFYTNNDGVIRDTYLRFGRVNGGVRYRATDRLSFGLNANLNTGESAGVFYWNDHNTPYIGKESTLGERERLRYNIDPFLTYYDGSGNRHKVLGRYYSVSNDADMGQSNGSNTYYGEYQFQRAMNEKRTVLTLGVVGQKTDVSAELYGDTTFISSNLASYVQLDQKLGSRLNLSAGFRFEKNTLDNPGFEYAQGVVAPSDESESQGVFRLGANYKLGKASFLRASWGQGYRFPTIVERYIYTNVGFPILPNPELTSETGWSAELGVKQGFKSDLLQGFIDFALFTNRYQNMIEFNLVGFGFKATNIGDTRINGAEVSFQAQGKLLGMDFNTMGGYTHINPSFDEFDLNPIRPGVERTTGQINAENSTSDDNVLKYRSRHQVKMDVALRKNKVSVGWESFYNSKQEAIDAAFLILVPGVNDFRMENTTGWWINNFRIAAHWSEKITTTLLLNNTFNEVYSVRPGLMGDPRNISLRLDWNL